MISGPVLGTIAVVVLLLDRRRFFGQPVKAVSAVAEAM